MKVHGRRWQVIYDSRVEGSFLTSRQPVRGQGRKGVLGLSKGGLVRTGEWMWGSWQVVWEAEGGCLMQGVQSGGTALWQGNMISGYTSPRVRPTSTSKNE